MVFNTLIPHLSAASFHFNFIGVVVHGNKGGRAWEQGWAQGGRGMGYIGKGVGHMGIQGWGIRGAQGGVHAAQGYRTQYSGLHTL